MTDPVIGPDMIVLDVIAAYRSTERVFKGYEAETGACICCEALFDRLDDVAARYGIDLARMLADLEAARHG